MSLETTSLDPIFRPKTVAVIGASRRRDSIGYALIHNLVASQFGGAIFPVNPSASSIHSLKCYPSLQALPDPIDLAVIAVPKAAVAAVVDECLAIGVGGIVLITAGFAETGEEGARLERELRAKVRAKGVRMIGPNCMGVINTEPEVSLNATFAPTPAEAGSIGFVSQSGALGVAILNAAFDRGIGLTQFVSMGNKADVSGNDLLEYWEDDPATKVISMYLESFGNPRRFTEIAKRVGRKKPILIVKSGRTAAGARAASSHTGAIAGTDVTVSAFLEQCGVLRADTIEELFDVAQALSRCPEPKGKRVAILTNAGGPAIMATDACINLGLEIAEISETTRAELASFLPKEASLGNPIDMIASADPTSYRRSLAALLADDGVDQVMVINVTPLLSNPIDILEAVVEEAEGNGKPVLTVMMATEAFYEEVKSRRDSPPVYRFPESAARAMALLARYSEWRRSPQEEAVPELPIDHEGIDALLAASGINDGYLEPETAFRVLELCGIPVARRRQVADRRAVAQAAQEIGYPVVVKAIAPGMIHKSEAGAVKIDLRDRGELEEALDDMEASLATAGQKLEGFLVQEMARGGQEVIFGITADPRFGPLLMFGLGGKYVEVFRDVRFGVLPLTASEAREMIHGIRGIALLTGVRGEAGSDLALLEDILMRVAQLAQRHPEIAELDMNPFIAAPAGERSVAVDVRIRVAPEPTPLLVD